VTVVAQWYAGHLGLTSPGQGAYHALTAPDIHIHLDEEAKE